MPWVATLLWSLAAAGSAACGRIGFDDEPFLVETPPGAEARCGQAAATIAVAITNTADALIEIDANATGGFTIETALPLAIAAGATELLSVRAPVAVIGTDIPGTVKVGTLEIRAGDATRTYPLTSTVVGASLELTDENGTPLSLAFDSDVTCPAPVTARLVNTGTTTAIIAFIATPRVAVDGFSDGPLAPGASMTFSLRPVTASSCTGSFELSFTATGDVCDTVPAVLPGDFSINGSSSCSCS
jgi:hypothetical protein